MSTQKTITATAKLLPTYPLYHVALITLLTMLVNQAAAQIDTTHVTKALPTNACSEATLHQSEKLIPERRASKGAWKAETSNPSSLIILSAGHVNRISGTTGYNDASPVYLHGHNHTTEAALTKIITPFMVKVGRERGFDIRQFIAKSNNFKIATLELAHYEQVTQGIAFEIHSDAPSEGHHRAPGYNGQTGIIPPTNGTITPAEACAGVYMGKFKKGIRGLFAPKKGISLFELFPTNKDITQAVHYAAKTNDHTKIEKLALPYINLFFDALEQGGLKPL